jgi:hypothetical protein
MGKLRRMHCFKVKLDTTNSSRDTAKVDDQYIKVNAGGYLYVVDTDIARVAEVFPEALEIVFVGHAAAVAEVPPLVSEVELELALEEATDVVEGLLDIFESKTYKSLVATANLHGWNPGDDYNLNTAAYRRAVEWLKAYKERGA